ncbi:hypothetical protein [Streptomyces toxytricini]|uniref:hypothetical protein n=1 Tax=Streptomyces toxytricini TaxID=67369 RepID=UPI0016792CB3|nr:hypothetical protein [Streptomyces toxytricini]
MSEDEYRFSGLLMRRMGLRDAALALRLLGAVAQDPVGGYACLAPVVPGRDVALPAEVARIARVGRAAVANWRRRQSDAGLGSGHCSSPWLSAVCLPFATRVSASRKTGRRSSSSTW